MTGSSISIEEHLLPLRAWAEAKSESAVRESPPFIALLSREETGRLRADLLTVLTETDLTGERVDSAELQDILREFAEIAGWEGPLWSSSESEPPPYVIDLPGKDLKTLRTASAAVRRVVDEIVTGPLAQNPHTLAAAISQRVKKLADRNQWQVYLPDGYRLRYTIDEPVRMVRVVYLGPHSDSKNDGREQAVRQAIHRRRLDRNEPGEESGQ